MGRWLWLPGPQGGLGGPSPCGSVRTEPLSLSTTGGTTRLPLRPLPPSRRRVVVLSPFRATWARSPTYSGSSTPPSSISASSTSLSTTQASCSTNRLRMLPKRSSTRSSSSTTAMMLPTYGTYVATKGAVEQMSHVLAKELGPRGITVNVVSPGPTDTELFGQGKTEQDIQRFAQLAALGRLGQPEDIADVVALLVSDDANWITGQNIRANGGTI